MSVYRNDKAEWFETALNSMLGQTRAPSDIVIVIDGPIPEGLKSSIDSYKRKIPDRLHTVQLSENKGLAYAMRIGITECRCEWIARMDADDISEADRCEKELELGLAHNADIVGCDCGEFIGDPGNQLARRVFPETHQELVRFSKRKTPFCHPAVMMKKSAVLRAGNYQEVYLLEDYDLFVRMLANGAVGYTVKALLYNVRVGSDFYSRRGGMKYVRQLLSFNYRLLKKGWTSPVDFFIRSCGNIVVGLAPSKVRSWMYRRLLRK